MPDLVFRIRADSELAGVLRADSDAVEITTDKLKELADVGSDAVDQVGDLEDAFHREGEAAVEAQEAGSASIEDLFDDIDSLKKRIDNTLESAKAGSEGVEDAVDDVGDSFDEAGKRAERTKRPINDVKDVALLLGPAVADFVKRWGPAVAAVTVAHKAVSGLADRMESFSISQGKSEETARALVAPLRDMTAPWGFITGKAESYQVALEAARGILPGLKQQTEDIADAEKILARFAKEHNDALEQRQRQLDAIHARNQASIDAFLQSAAGFSLEGVKTELEDVLRISESLRDTDLLDSGPFAAALQERVDGLSASMELYGERLSGAVPEESLQRFQALSAELANARDAADLMSPATDSLAASQDALAEAVGKSVEGLKSQITELEAARGQITGLEADVLGAIDKLQGADGGSSGSGASPGDPADVAKLKDEISALEEEERGLAEAFTLTADEMNRQSAIAGELFEKKVALADAEKGLAAEVQVSFEAQSEKTAEFRDILASATDQIAAMPEEVRGPLDALVARFQGMNETVGSGSADVQEFEALFKASMATAAADVGAMEIKAKGSLQRTEAAFESLTDTGVKTTRQLIAEWNELNTALALTKKLQGEIEGGFESLADLI